MHFKSEMVHVLKLIPQLVSVTFGGWGKLVAVDRYPNLASSMPLPALHNVDSHLYHVLPPPWNELLHLPSQL